MKSKPVKVFKIFCCSSPLRLTNSKGSNDNRPTSLSKSCCGPLTVVPSAAVIVHVGYALQKLDQEEAERTLELFAEMGALDELRSELSGSTT